MEDEKVRIQVQIPANTKARVKIGNIDYITGSGTYEWITQL